jgi:hypothetical protein
MYYVGHYDTTCLRLMAVIHGQRAMERNRRAPKNIKGAEALYPSEPACIAATPNRRIGIVSGIIRRVIKTPDRLDPKTKAAPTAPKRLIIGVPKAMLPIRLK